MSSKYKLSCSHNSVPSHWGQGSGTSRWLRICPRVRGIWGKSQAWTAGIQALRMGCSVGFQQRQPTLTCQTSPSARHTLWAGTPGASDSGPSCPAAHPLHVSASPQNSPPGPSGVLRLLRTRPPLLTLYSPGPPTSYLPRQAPGLTGPSSSSRKPLLSSQPPLLAPHKPQLAACRQKEL